MKNLIFTLGVSALLLFTLGCSDNDNPVNPGDTPPDNTATSTWIEAGEYWQSTINASDYDEYACFSFATRDTVTDAATGNWDIGFRREVVKLNGGSSAVNGGDALGTSLGSEDFGLVSIDDTTGVSWTPDVIDHFIDEWYDYNPVTHELTANQNVYSMVDAGGANYLKFRVDSIVGAGMPPDMGTVHITYFYQNTADSRDLSGAVTQAAITVGSGTGYFDFSSGAQVNPIDPENSLDWDIGFNSYELFQNSGPNGDGSCAAFLAYSELTDPTDIEAFTAQPSGAPMFPDIPGSAMTDWYDYNGQTHQLTSKGEVYLIKTGDAVYKVRIESYYTSIMGTPASGYYTFIWSEL